MNIDFNNIGNFCSVKNSSKNLKHSNDKMSLVNFDELLSDSFDYIDIENVNIDFEVQENENFDCDNLISENGINNCEFEDSDNSEIVNLENRDDNTKKIDDKDFKEDYNEETDDDENFENLKSLVYILDTICTNYDKDKNIFDFNKSGDFDRFCNSNKINEESLSKILCVVGCDEVSVENKNVSNEEVLKQIFNDTENFKMVLRNEVIKFEEKEFDNSILKILDSGNFLDDEELLKNLKSEITNKLNESVFVSKEGNKLEYTLSKFVSPKNLDSSEGFNHLKDTNALKEIYGDTDLSKSIENYYVDLVRNNELSNVIFEKVIDGSNMKKFQKELIETVEYMSSKGKSQMSIKITPDHLGKIDIRYEVTKNNIRVVIRAEKNEAIKLIDSTVAQIKNMVRENHQIDLKNIYVDVGKFEFGSNGRENSRQDNNENKNIKKNILEIENDSSVDGGNDLRSGVLV